MRTFRKRGARSVALSPARVCTARPLPILRQAARPLSPYLGGGESPALERVDARVDVILVLLRFGRREQVSLTVY